MPKISLVDTGHGISKFINVGASVGRNGVNNPADVIIVQALFKYAWSGKGNTSGDVANIITKQVFPEPTGAYNHHTAKLIRKYQEYLSIYRKVTRDGRIDPANGQAAYGKNKEWTIVQLNMDAEWEAMNAGKPKGQYISEICDRWSQVKAALNGVGSLNLELEPSASSVGSLGLGLE